jgi:hypothetical protein
MVLDDEAREGDDDGWGAASAACAGGCGCGGEAGDALSSSSGFAMRSPPRDCDRLRSPFIVAASGQLWRETSERCRAARGAPAARRVRRGQSAGQGRAMEAWESPEASVAKEILAVTVRIARCSRAAWSCPCLAYIHRQYCRTIRPQARNTTASPRRPSTIHSLCALCIAARPVPTISPASRSRIAGPCATGCACSAIVDASLRGHVTHAIYCTCILPRTPTSRAQSLFHVYMLTCSPQPRISLHETIA